MTPDRAGLPAPALSVIVASYNSRSTIERCLASLDDQTLRDFETIVVDSSPDGTAGFIAERFPRVRLHRASRRLYPGDARNTGIALSRAPVIAFLDSDSYAAPTWAEEIIKAHADPYPAIGGVVDTANPESRVAWAAYFCEFSQWMPGFERRSMRDIPTCCLSLKRWVFERYGSYLEGSYCSDTALNWKLADSGFPPLFLPSIRIFHVNITVWNRFLRKQVMHGEAFAGVRVRERRLSRSLSAALTFGTPLLPLILLVRIGFRVFESRVYLRNFFRVVPLVLIGLAAWSWGEARGYFLCLGSSHPVYNTEDTQKS
ncbi:MAG: glycosyltransferase family 2 protein [Bryobacteraceae bacterium]